MFSFHAMYQDNIRGVIKVVGESNNRLNAMFKYVKIIDDGYFVWTESESKTD